MAQIITLSVTSEKVLVFKGQKEGQKTSMAVALELPCSTFEFRTFLDNAKRFVGLGADKSVEVAEGLNLTYVRGKSGQQGYYTATLKQKQGRKVVEVSYEPEEGATGNTWTYGPAMDAVNDYFKVPENESLFTEGGEDDSPNLEPSENNGKNPEEQGE